EWRGHRHRRERRRTRHRAQQRSREHGQRRCCLHGLVAEPDRTQQGVQQHTRGLLRRNGWNGNSGNCELLGPRHGRHREPPGLVQEQAVSASHAFEANVSQQSKVGIRISMPRKPTILPTGYPGGDPSRRQARPDAGARKAAKKVRDLEAMAKQFVPSVLDPSRITAMSTGELLAALEELVRAEAFYLSR